MAAFEIGERVARDVTFDEEGIRNFATLAGDESKLHHDAAFAEGTRFGGLIASATQYTALLMGMVATMITQRGAGLGLEFAFQFRKAVRAGQIMRLEWEITAVEPAPKLGGDFVHLTGRMVGPGGEIAVTASAKILVMPETAL